MSPMEQLREIISKSGPVVLEKKFLEVLHVCIGRASSPIHHSHVFYGSKFREQCLKRVTQGTFL